MTAPVYPLAQQGRFPDGPAVAMDILAGAVIDGVAIGPEQTGTRTPPESDWPFFHVMRTAMAGGLSRNQITDTVVLYVAALSFTRAQSQDMLEEARRVLGAHEHNTEHKGVLIDYAWESGAPGPMAEDSDDRRVESGWTFQFRRHFRPTVYA